MKVNEIFKVSGTLSEGNSISWSMGDNKIATIDKTTTASKEEISITGIKAGVTTLTATTVVNEKTYCENVKLK